MVFKLFGLVLGLIIIENWSSIGFLFDGIGHKRWKSRACASQIFCVIYNVFKTHCCAMATSFFLNLKLDLSSAYYFNMLKD